MLQRNDVIYLVFGQRDLIGDPTLFAQTRSTQPDLFPKDGINVSHC